MAVAYIDRLRKTMKSLRVVDNLAEIRTGYLLNTSVRTRELHRTAPCQVRDRSSDLVK